MYKVLGGLGGKGFELRGSQHVIINSQKKKRKKRKKIIGKIILFTLNLNLNPNPNLGI